MTPIHISQDTSFIYSSQPTLTGLLSTHSCLSQITIFCKDPKNSHGVIQSSAKKQFLSTFTRRRPCAGAEEESGRTTSSLGRSGGKARRGSFPGERIRTALRQRMLRGLRFLEWFYLREDGKERTARNR